MRSDRRYALVAGSTSGREVPLAEAIWLVDDALFASSRLVSELETWDAVRARLATRRARSVRNAVRDLLVEGELRVVAMFPWSGIDVPSRVDGGHTVEPQPKKPTSQNDGPTWFEVRVVDEIGEPVAGAPVLLRLEDDRDLHTTGDGRARADDAQVQFGQARLEDLDALAEALRPRWDGARSDPWLEPCPDHTFHPLRSDALSASILAETPHTLVVQPWVIRARLIGMYFDTNKAFLLPTAMGSICNIKQLYDAYPTAAVLVVGHTDTTGDPSYNDPLSVERAKSTAAFLQDDVDAWLAWYGAGVAYEKRWGGREDGLMLAALPDGPNLQVSPNPIAAFQTTRGLTVDGWAGPQTRRQLITEYMSQDQTTLPDAATIAAHGCGESFPLEGEELAAIQEALDVDDDQVQRRVEIYFFDGRLGVQPPPPGSVSPPGSTAYPEWVRRARETHDFSLKSVMRIRVFDHFAVPMAGVDYRVEFSDHLREGKTDASGCIVLEGKIPSATTCKVNWNRLSVSDHQSDPSSCFEFEKIVHLDADHRVDDDALRTRLTNLGFEPGAELEDCVRHFQFQHDLPVNGDPSDAEMVATLVARHHAMAPERREGELTEVGASNHA